MPALPDFDPSAAGTGGLDLLAAVAVSPQAALQAANPTPTLPTTSPSLLVPGPFNPAEVLPAKVIRRIIDLEFLEMAEVAEPELPLVPGRPPPPGRPPVTELSQWLERYSLMAVTLAIRFPHKGAP